MLICLNYMLHSIAQLVSFLQMNKLFFTLKELFKIIYMCQVIDRKLLVSVDSNDSTLMCFCKNGVLCYVTFKITALHLQIY